MVLAWTSLFVPLAHVAHGWANTSVDIYDRSLVGTLLGCTCTTPCAPFSDIECAAHSVCSVESRWCRFGAANHSEALGYYDFCAFGQYRPYERLNAHEKQQLLWQHLKADTSSSDFTPGPTPADVRLTWGSLSDVWPVEGRRKGNVGVVAPMRFVSNGDHNYTGLFKGAEFGLIRLVTFNNPAKGHWRQGLGVKFLRDGIPSANFVAYASPLGQATQCASDTRYFARDFVNHVVADDHSNDNINFKKFFQATGCPKLQGLSDIATEMHSVATPKFPFQVVLRGVLQDNVRLNCNSSDAKDWFAEITRLKAGTKLFYMYAKGAPGGELEAIGHIQLTDRFTTSQFGDRQFFFKHQSMEEDFRLRPDWLTAIDLPKICGLPDRPTRALDPTPFDGCNAPMRDDDDDRSQAQNGASILPALVVHCTLVIIANSIPTA
jgi:hypothetical protein